MATAHQERGRVRQDAAGDRCGKSELEICTNLCRKFTEDTAYLEHELRHSGPNVLCLVLKPEHITGKKVKES